MEATTPDSINDTTNVSPIPANNEAITSPELHPNSTEVDQKFNEYGEQIRDTIVSPNEEHTPVITGEKDDSSEAQTENDEQLTKLETALRLRDKLDALIRRTVQTKKKCEKLDHDNKYLQDYVGNLMNSGELFTRRI